MTIERRSKGRTLSAEEEALWRGVAASVEPLATHQRRRAKQAAPAVAEANGTATAPNKPPRAVKAVTSPDVPTPAAKPKKPRTPPIADFEARAARRLAAGKLPIDARIDLHGMRQDEARAALQRFLAVSQLRGDRHVKVITGKGRKANDSEPFEMFDDRRGVLRETVPVWLSGPDMRDLVVSFTAAARSHGGDGALYVRLRRRK